MTLPLDLIFIRHGQSEGNAAMAEAKAAEKAGKAFTFTDKYVTTPERQWRLTAEGVKQAHCAGAWLRNESTAGAFGDATRRYFVSPLVRTRQTAGHLGLLPHLDNPVEWRLNRSIRERDWGDIGTITRTEFRETYAHSARRERMDPLYWRPPGGEAIADVADLRVRNFLDTLHREESSSTVFAVSHGEYIRAAHLVLLRGNDELYSQWEEDKSMSLKNCEVVHYTRVTPHSFVVPAGFTPNEYSRMRYVRRARPVLQANGDFAMEVDPWELIEHKLYSNEDLLAI